jgi:transcriptional regulator NrdR family protein
MSYRAADARLCPNPDCGSTDRTVLETRLGKNYVRRRSQCDRCSTRYTTRERLYSKEEVEPDLDRSAVLCRLRDRCSSIQESLEELRSILDRFIDIP